MLEIRNPSQSAPLTALPKGRSRDVEGAVPYNILDAITTFVGADDLGRPCLPLKGKAFRNKKCAAVKSQPRIKTPL